MQEVKATDPATGGSKGQKQVQLADIDAKALEMLGAVAGFGATKYGHLNYLKGYPWSWSYNALQRHAMAFWGGQDLDEEMNLPHLAAVAWHALALLAFHTHGKGTDDRFKG